jgi:hypothetical protein
LVIWLAGSAMRPSSAPLSGSWQLTQPPPQWAIQIRPAASVVMPSGTPSSRSKRSHSRGLPIAPLAASNANASTRPRTVSLKYIVRSSSDQVGPFVTANPISWRVQRPSGSKR